MTEEISGIVFLSAAGLLNGAFRRLLHMSIAGSFGILLVLLLRQWINRRCGRGYSYGAWLIVFLYLCIPVMVPWEVSPFTVRILAYLEDAEQPSQDDKGNISSDESSLEQSSEWMSGQSGESEAPTEDAAETGSDVTAGIVPPNSSEEGTGNIGNTGNSGNAGNNSNIIPSTGVQSTVQSNVPEASEGTVESSSDTLISENHPSATDPLQSTKKGVSLLTALSLIWMAGVFCFFITMLTSFLHLQSRLSSATKLETAEIATETGVYYGNVYQCSNISGAFVWGLLPINTRIYVPCGLASEEQEAILRHERYHQKRHDNIVKPLMLAILALHWFNPLVWLAYHYLVVDMELSCDEGVISRMESKEDRARYATALLSVAARKNRILLVTGMGTAVSTKKRIQAILSYKGGSAMKKRSSVELLLVLALVLGACAAQQLPNNGNVSDISSEAQENTEENTKGNNTEEDSAEENVAEEISSEDTSTEKTSTEISPTKPDVTEPATEPTTESSVDTTDFSTRQPYWVWQHCEAATPEKVVEDNRYVTYYKYSRLEYLTEPEFNEEDGGVKRSETSLFDTTQQAERVQQLALKDGKMVLLSSWYRHSTDQEADSSLICYRSAIGLADQVFAADAGCGLIQIGNLVYDVYHKAIYSPQANMISEVYRADLYVVDLDINDETIEFIYTAYAQNQCCSMILQFDTEAGLLKQLAVLPNEVLACDGQGILTVKEQIDVLETSRQYVFLKLEGDKIVHEPQEIFPYEELKVYIGLDAWINRHESEEYDLRSVVELKLYSEMDCNGEYMILQPQQIDLIATDIENYVQIKALQDNITGWLYLDEITLEMFSGWYTAG